MINERALNLLKEYIKENYKNIRLEDSYYDNDEFYYEFKMDERISENDFKKIEEDLFKMDSSIYIKIIRISGVYYKGKMSNEMIDRIVAKAFNSKKELEDYLLFIEESKDRDHRKIGRELDLFCFSDYVGAGLPMYSPRGVIVRDELQKEVERICKKYGFMKVSCPSLADISLFEVSGHAFKFNDELFRVKSPKGHEFVLKPVQCPHHCQLYASKLRSYKELPIRYMESDKQYRAELQGAVSGLSRVYAISVEDGHSFCRKDQVKQEVINMCNIIKDFYSNMGLWDNHWVSLSLKDKQHPEKYIGSEEDWDECERILEEVCNELGLNAKKCYGEAALYGPKIDFMFKDALGREIQIPTVQLDFASPKRFELFYIDENGNKEVPVMVHRVILGSYERFLVLLLEQFKGVLPIWLSPIQVNIIPVSIKHHDEYCKKIRDLLIEEDIRVNYDDGEERMAKKLKESNMLKNPYNIIIGDNEVKNNLVSYSKFASDEKGIMSIEDFINFIKKEIKKR